MLAGEGVPAGTPIASRHAGSTTIAMRSTVGEAARWTIEESDGGGLRRRIWRPHSNAAPGGAGAPENERGDQPGTKSADRRRSRVLGGLAPPLGASAGDASPAYDTDPSRRPSGGEFRAVYIAGQQRHIEAIAASELSASPEISKIGRKYKKNTRELEVKNSALAIRPRL